MPLKSKAQEKWMWATHPKMAKKWEAETPDRNKLPNYARQKGATVKKKYGIK